MLIALGLAAALQAAEVPDTAKTTSAEDVASATAEVVTRPRGPYIVEAEACLSWLDREPMGPESKAQTDHPEFIRVRESSYQCVQQIRFGDPKKPESGVTVLRFWERKGKGKRRSEAIRLLPIL